MFELFLIGKSCEQIQRANPAFQLGQIVSARIQGEWAQAQTANLLADMLFVANKLNAAKLEKFLQTGDERHLGNLRIENVKSLKEVMELLLQTTGQGGQKRVGGTIEHKHTVENIASDKKEEEKTADSEEASKILEFLAGVKEVGK